MERWSWWGLGNRPAVFPVVAALFGVVFGPGLEVPAWLWLALGALSLVGVWWLRRVGPVLLGLVAAMAIGAGLAELSLDVAMPPFQERVTIEGEVERVAPHGLVVQVSALEGEPSRFRAALAGEVSGVVVGERVLVEAKFRPLSEASNPGEWSRSEWAWRRGQSVVGSFKRARLVRLEAASAWSRWLRQEHAALAASTHRLTEQQEAAALLLTLSAGLRASLDEEVEESFAKSGLAHVLSVSGLHVAVLAFTIFAALRWLLSRRQTRRTRVADPRAFAAPLAVPLVWVYVIFTGWQGPAVRSGVMCTLVLLAWVVRRRSDPLNAIAIAGLAMIAVDPAAPFDLSVQLSFGAVVSLVLLSPVLRAAVPLEMPSPARFEGWPLRWRRWRETVVQTICSSLAVTAGTGPLVLMAFQRVSLAGVLSTVVALPLSGVITLVAAAGAAGHVVSPVAAMPVLWLGVQLSRLLLGLAEFFAAMPGASVSLPAASALLMATWWLGWARLGRVSITSNMRSAEASAAVTWGVIVASTTRGTKIVTRYWVKAISSPTVLSPWLTARPPNHSTRAVARFTIKKKLGCNAAT
jgi:competence protein ComEC